MKSEWEKVRNKLDDLESTDKLDWKKIKNKDLEIVRSNLHRRERKHWAESVSNEIEKRRYFLLKIIGILTLFFAIIAVIIGILQFNCDNTINKEKVMKVLKDGGK
jgi:hypothetical protein